MVHLAQPWVLLGLPLVAVVGRLSRRRRQRSVAVPAVAPLLASGLAAPAWKRHGRLVLRLMVLVLLLLAAARPQTGRSEATVTSRGIDIMLVLDASGSMRAEDFQPRNRLAVARDVVKDFIDRRRRDRLGLVAFAAEAVTQCPLTLDHEVLKQLVDRLRIGMLPDGTAIGVALGTACNRLRESRARSRVVVLLTDGQNNAGALDPRTAARVAASLGIKVYTVGVGTRGTAPVPVDDPVLGRRLVPMRVDLDETTLRAIADSTGGRYFRATNGKELAAVYDEIDKLETSPIKTRTYIAYTERAGWFLLPALALLLLELVLGRTALRELPS